MGNRYVCSICGRSNVKLWRPYMNTEPLVCARCAEERQSPLEYPEYIWEKTDEHEYHGIATGKMLPFPKWEVDEKGKVPYAECFYPECEIPVKTDQLIVDLSDISQQYPSKKTDLIPAIPKEDEAFWGYTSVPEDRCKWWEELPTK